MSMTAQAPAPGNQPILVVRDVHKHFGGIQAANGVDLEVGRGEIAGLIGPNGSGKSTLFNLVAGMETPDRGQIVFDGHEIGGMRACREPAFSSSSTTWKWCGMSAIGSSSWIRGGW